MFRRHLSLLFISLLAFILFSEWDYPPELFAAWGSKQTILNDEAIGGAGNTEEFTSIVNTNPGSLQWVQVKGNSQGTTDNLNVALYDSVETWSTVAVFSFEIDATSGADVLAGFQVSGIPSWRIGVTAGGTDSIDATIVYRDDGVSL